MSNDKIEFHCNPTVAEHGKEALEFMKRNPDFVNINQMYGSTGSAGMSKFTPSTGSAKLKAASMSGSEYTGRKLGLVKAHADALAGNTTQVASFIEIEIAKRRTLKKDMCDSLHTHFDLNAFNDIFGKGE